MIFICILVFIIGLGLGVLTTGFVSGGSFVDQLQDAYDEGYRKGKEDKEEV